MFQDTDTTNVSYKSDINTASSYHYNVHATKNIIVINDYEKLHELFGQLLKETQRIKSEGDYEAVEALVEGYGVKVDQDLHKEVLERNAQFTSAPYSGFVNPVIVPKLNEAGEIEGFSIEQPTTFKEQMIYYSKTYNFLPEVN